MNLAESHQEAPSWSLHAPTLIPIGRRGHKKHAPDNFPCQIPDISNHEGHPFSEPSWQPGAANVNSDHLRPEKKHFGCLSPSKHGF